LSTDQIAREVSHLVSLWTYQRESQFSGYADLYHPQQFVGIRRTSSGKVTELDAVRWLAERKRMSKKRPDVEVIDLAIRTWLDDPALPTDTSVAEFLQRWRTTNGRYYADHGSKRLTLWRDSSGRQWIVREEMLTSAPGWNEWDPHYNPELAAAVRQLEEKPREATDGGPADEIAVDLLQRLVDHPDCDTAMAAAAELARRGDPSRLPRRPTSNVLAEHARQLCVLSNDRDEARREKILRTFLAPSGEIELERRDCSAGDGFNPEPVFDKTATAAELRRDDLDRVFERAPGIDCRKEQPDEMTCIGHTFQGLEFTLTTIPGRGIYIRRLASEANGSCGD
jgi:hypothetical protein